MCIRDRNITIAKMTWAEGRKIICVYAVPAESDFPALLPWKDKYLSPDSFVLVLGESLTGPVTVNLANKMCIRDSSITPYGKLVACSNTREALHGQQQPIPKMGAGD